MGFANKRRTKGKEKEKGIFDLGLNFMRRPLEKEKYRNDTNEREGLPTIQSPLRARLTSTYRHNSRRS
jgi:hypothetical protein